MGNWYCKCGHRMSNGQCPTPHGYEVFTSRQCCEGDLDEQRPYADAYICPECGRIMIFGRDADCYMLYKAEPVEDFDADKSMKLEKSFSDEAWETYSGLSEKDDAESVGTVKDINELIQKLQDEGDRELSVRNKLVGQEHQVCYRAHRGVIEIISIERIFA